MFAPFFFWFIDFDETLLKAAEDALPIPFGSGIAGHVAQTKSGLRITDAYRVSDCFPLDSISEDFQYGGQLTTQI